jgi:hypothetical protein
MGATVGLIEARSSPAVTNGGRASSGVQALPCIGMLRQNSTGIAAIDRARNIIVSAF